MVRANFAFGLEPPPSNHPAERAPYAELAAMGDETASGRWHAWVLPLGRFGRLTLPAEARAVADGRPSVRAESRGPALVLRSDGIGRPTHLDDRGRLYVPAWLRRASGDGAVLVAASRPVPSVVVVAPVGVLDGVLDALCGEVA